MHIEPGTSVDRYVVEGLIGQGGVASVYRVRHSGLGTVHALKVVHVPSPAVTERLLREGRVQGKLRHPNVVSVTDLVNIRGAPGLVMELVPGPSLDAFLKRYRPSVEEADALARDIMAGVAAAHRVDLVHRDLKPANILIEVADGRVVPKIVDFGLAKVLEAEPDSPLATRAGSTLGTPAYMAPEQLIDASTVDERADVFALGAILFEVVAGRRAFRGESVSAVQNLIRTGDHAPFPDDLPEQWKSALIGSLQTNKEDRTATVDDLRQAWTGGHHIAPIHWSPDALEAASAASGVPLPTTAPNSSTFADSLPTSQDTWLPDGMDLGSTVPDVPAPTAGPGERRALWLGAGVVAAIAVGVASWFMQPAPLQVLTADAAPIVAEGNTQRQFEESWEAVLRGDFTEAHRRLGPVRKAVPNAPLPHLLDAETLMLAGDTPASLEAMRDAHATITDGHDGPGSELVALFRDIQARGSAAVGPALLGYIEQYPDDYLARIMAAQYCSTTSKVDICERTHAGLLAVDDSHLVAHMAIARSWSDLGELERVRAAADRGLLIDPAEPWLLSVVGSTWLAEGNVPKSREALQRAVDADSGRSGPKVGLAQAALMADDGQFDTIAQELLAPTVPSELRVALHTDAAETLHGLGRINDAMAHLELALTIEQEEGTPLGALTVMSAMTRVANHGGTSDLSLSLLERQNELIANSPEIPNPIRNRFAASKTWYNGLIAGTNGDRDGVVAALERVQRAEYKQPTVVESLKRELAIQDSDAKGIQDNAGFFWTDCDRHAALGEAYRRAKLPELAKQEWEGVLDSRCRLHRPGRYNRVIALVGLAELSTDAIQRDAWLAEARALWPRPDRQIPLAVRLYALQSGDGEPTEP